ncbi:tetratricopeptide repeat protein [Rhizobium sp. P38BS-XIX]|nr:tetratricopeptide repeat protein [Rhizobium sp. P38BS-XIX]NLR97969.1 tetratricopeptide repeat protein [Rhizobium sp. P38BS-XIX]
MIREFRLASTFLRVGHPANSAKDAPVPINVLAEADAARNRRDWPSAAYYYAQAVEQQPGRIGLYVQLGHAYKESGDFEAALEAYRRFLEEEPDDPDIHLQLGHLYNRMHDLETALQWYDRAHELSPNDTEIAQHSEKARQRVSRVDVENKRQRAMELVQSRRWQPAREQLRDLVVNDGEEDLIAVYANVTKEAGDFDEALRLYDIYRDYAKNHDAASMIDVEIQTAHLYKAMRDIRSALHHYIRARDVEFDLYGHITPDSISGQEIRSCMGQIYTCFWRPD